MNERLKILAAYDGSTCADDALGDLARAGLPREADALIVLIQEQWLSQPSASYETVEEKPAVFSNSGGAKAAFGKPKTSNKYLEKLEQAFERLNSHFPEWRIETLHRQGSPAREVIRQAKDWNAHLIIIGSHGNTENKRSALGSVSQKIANEAACSVRVVRGQAWKNGSPSRILIGLDDSRGALAAVEETARRMWIMGSEVRLVAVCDESEKDSEWLRERLENARKMLERAELIVTELIETGDPKQILAAAAEEWGADCIFLGANDAENSSENHLLGSVSTAIVARAHCTVEIVR